MAASGLLRWFSLKTIRFFSALLEPIATLTNHFSPNFSKARSLAIIAFAAIVALVTLAVSNAAIGIVVLAWTVLAAVDLAAGSTLAVTLVAVAAAVPLTGALALPLCTTTAFGWDAPIYSYYYDFSCESVPAGEGWKIHVLRDKSFSRDDRDGFGALLDQGEEFTARDEPLRHSLPYGDSDAVEAVGMFISRIFKRQLS
jgi:hypothetical protein